MTSDETVAPQAKPKGHWPKGKRRNVESPEWSATRELLVQILRDHPAPMIRSASAIAAVVGVSPKSVGRWLKGEDLPGEPQQAVMREWADAALEQIRKV
ncbi:hypothetical protein [Schlesneria sp. T3-172]|uniref:hypothetical protein n=1 Tax=Schlesneria sphaerica TaxID=3373610 RepID=UPI0037CAC62C